MTPSGSQGAGPLSLQRGHWGQRQCFHPNRNKSRAQRTQLTTAFIAVQEEPAAGRQAHCPSLPRPSAACATAFVTVLVTVSVTSFTTLSPDSWAFFKASAMAVGEEEGECPGEQRKQFKSLAVLVSRGVSCGMWQSHWVAPCRRGTEQSAAPG